MFTQTGGRVALLVCLTMTVAASEANAQGFGRRYGPPKTTVIYAPAGSVVATTSTRPFPPPTRQLGTFYPASTLYVRGNGVAGGGYSPLGQFGNASMTLYGPTSAFRDMSAPVRTYASGYNGEPVLMEGTSFSSPNEPDRSPVVYPTQATDYYGFKQSKIPPWWPNGINWIDQN